MIYLWITLFVLVLIVGWLLTVIGMPGNWLMVVAAVGYELLVPDGSARSLGWIVVGVLAALAALGELAEFAAGALGASKAGGSRRGVALAMLGSLGGGILGLFVGLPVPVIGPVLGAVLFAAAGALVGAMAGERWAGKGWGETWKAGRGAFWGRVLGTVAKIGVATAMVLVAAAAVVF
jgi:uncharacterized protein YqgC (DUF456 family)